MRDNERDALVGVEVASLPALWRSREDNGEERTEFDKGYEQASDECAESLERALAQQPAADEEAAEQFRKGWQAGFAEGRRDQQPAAVECDCPVGQADHASWCAISKAQDAAQQAEGEGRG